MRRAAARTACIVAMSGSQIMLCSARADEWFRRVVLHELAHAWSEFGLTAERRGAFRLLRGWDHWMNYELVEWRDNGAEQAAEVIVCGRFGQGRADGADR